MAQVRSLLELSSFTLLCIMPIKNGTAIHHLIEKVLWSSSLWVSQCFYMALSFASHHVLVFDIVTADC